MSKPKNDTANARPKRKKTALIIAIVLLLVALVAAGVLVFRYWSQQNAYQELETYVEVEEDPNVVKLPTSAQIGMRCARSTPIS